MQKTLVKRSLETMEVFHFVFIIISARRTVLHFNNAGRVHRPSRPSSTSLSVRDVCVSETRVYEWYLIVVTSAQFTAETKSFASSHWCCCSQAWADRRAPVAWRAAERFSGTDASPFAEATERSSPAANGDEPAEQPDGITNQRSDLPNGEGDDVASCDVRLLFVSGTGLANETPRSAAGESPDRSAYTCRNRDMFRNSQVSDHLLASN